MTKTIAERVPGILMNILGFALLNIVAFGQSMNIQHADSELGITLPQEYLDFRADYSQQEFEFFFRIDTWKFLDIKAATEKTIELRKTRAIGDRDFAFAINEDFQVLFYQSSSKVATKISHLDEENDIIFYAFSLSEFANFETTQRLIEEIETDGFENQDLSVISACTGSLFHYAYALNTSEFDENFSEERNKKALELFMLAADRGHPEAAHEVANYYYFQDDVNTDSVLKWRGKAVENGSIEDVFELADFLIDHKADEIDRAISLLESLLNKQWYRERALLKLSRIYMRGTGGRQDYKKGIRYARECSEENNYNALSDLAMYYYKGMGVEKDVQKAYDLLVQAEKRIIEETGSGMWEDFIKKLKQELKQ